MTGATPNATFSSAYAGSVEYYAAMTRFGSVAVDPDEPVGHRAWIHSHCRIVGPNGPQTLAIPIEKSSLAPGATVRQLRIAEHAGWRRVHWGALFSAYGKTPFFEHVAPDLLRLYERGDKWLIDFNMSLHELVADFLDLPITTCGVTGGVDMRHRVGEKEQNGYRTAEYWQIWAGRHGFVPGLSILDLLMNTGREAILTLTAATS